MWCEDGGAGATGPLAEGRWLGLGEEAGGRPLGLLLPLPPSPLWMGAMAVPLCSEAAAVPEGQAPLQTLRFCLWSLSWARGGGGWLVAPMWGQHVACHRVPNFTLRSGQAAPT